MYINVSYRTRAAGTDRIRARGGLLAGFYSRRGEVSPVFFFFRLRRVQESHVGLFSLRLSFSRFYIDVPLFILYAQREPRNGRRT